MIVHRDYNPYILNKLENLGEIYHGFDMAFI